MRTRRSVTTARILHTHLNLCHAQSNLDGAMRLLAALSSPPSLIQTRLMTTTRVCQGMRGGTGIGCSSSIRYRKIRQAAS